MILTSSKGILEATFTNDWNSKPLHPLTKLFSHNPGNVTSLWRQRAAIELILPGKFLRLIISAITATAMVTAASTQPQMTATAQSGKDSGGINIAIHVKFSKRAKV